MGWDCLAYKSYWLRDHFLLVARLDHTTRSRNIKLEVVLKVQKMARYASFCLIMVRFLFLSFFVSVTHTGCTGGPILTIYMSYDIFPHTDVPFGGSVDIPQHLGFVCVCVCMLNYNRKRHAIGYKSAIFCL